MAMFNSYVSSTEEMWFQIDIDEICGFSNVIYLYIHLYMGVQ